MRNIYKYKNHNCWISILRIYMCFMVILLHFAPKEDYLICYPSMFAVPCFVFLSFFLASNDFYELNWEALRKKVVRLVTPILFWNVVYHLIYNVGRDVLTRKTYNITELKKFFINILLNNGDGNSPYQLWFLTVEVVLVVTIAFAFLIFRNKNVVLLLLFILSFIYEYTGINYYLFGTAVAEVSSSLGRIIECLPFAVSGILFSRYKDMRKDLLLFIWFAMLALSLFININVPQPKGFNYSGLYIALMSNVICMIVLSLPDLFVGKIRLLINFVGSCTMGIFCLHTLVGNCMLRFLYESPIYQTLGCDVLIFLLCLCISILIRWVNTKLNWKWMSYVV